MITLPANIAHYTFEIDGLNDAFRVLQYDVDESLSATFLGKLQLVSEKEDIDFARVVGKIALLSIYDHDLNQVRYLHGIVNQFDQVGQKKRLTHYYVELVPHLTLLNYRRHNRIFQHLTVEAIIQHIIKHANLPPNYCEIALSGSYQARHYCVQFGETDLNFIQRLMQEEGMFYFFEHSKTSHTLRIADHLSVHKAIVNPELVYNQASHLVADKNYVYALRYSQAIQPGSVRLNDFNFEKPYLKMQVDAEAETDPHLNLYDYPGSFDLPERGKTLATVMLESHQAQKTVITGRSNCRQLLPGYLFTVSQHPRRDFNQTYLVTEVKQSATQPQVLEESGAASKTTYESCFTCIPKGIAYRAPHHLSTKPRLEGVQTAIVVGPPGEEIYTDEHGRVKVQFHWDLDGQQDDKTSCWIRVSQAWAGEGWGALFIPRVGQEVVVAFVNGDPDRPLITGRVYHGTNTPPYNLPANKTQSGLKTHSTPGGGVTTFNELRFEDKKGSEEIFIQAEKNFYRLVKNNEQAEINANLTLKVTEASQQKAKSVLIDAADIIELKVGGSSIKITPTGIVVETTKVDVKGNAIVNINGGLVKIN
ncbi:MAG: type VI secretion system tip protein VgrG [Gammaproteobacteria bacterium]|nr:type VI secretion system tip protein VgrG [Gammaproteobacteria bacterium]